MKRRWFSRLSATAVALLIVMVAAPVYAASSPVFPISDQWTLTSPYGYRIHPITGNRDFHEGADIGVPVGTPVHAAMGGTVVQAGWRGGYGYAVEIDHGNGVSTLYAHLSRVLVAVGDVVGAGQVVALSGNTGNSTGPHLHFEIRDHGQPIDPAQWFPQLSGGAPFGIGPTDGGATGALVSGVAGLVSEILSGLRGEINQWLVGVFVGLMLVVILPAQALTDFGGLLDAIRSGNWGLDQPTPLFPWRLEVGGGVNGLAVTVGAVLWLFAVLRGARRLVEGDEAPLPVIQALALNLALLVAAPFLVRAGAAIYNQAYESILAALPEQVRHSTSQLLWALLGLEDWFERAAFIALASLGYVTSLTPASNLLAQIGQVVLGLPTLLVVLWAIALTAVGLQVLAALLFIGLTPALVWIFGLFGDSWQAVKSWTLMVGRAFLAAGIAAAAGALWLGMDVSGTLGRGFFGNISLPFLSTALYLFLALVIWSLWTRPALVLLYAGLPAAGRVLVGLGATAQGAGRLVASLPGGRVLGPALAGAGGTLRQWGQSTGELRRRLERVAGEGTTPAGPFLQMQDAQHNATELPANPLGIESVQEPGVLSTDGDSTVIRRRIRVLSEGVGDLLERALRAYYGNQYDQRVRREDERTFQVPMDFNPNDNRFQAAYQAEVRGRLPVIRRNGHYYAFVNGTWTRVPSRWAEASNALFLGDLDHRRVEGGRKAWKIASSGR